MADAHWWQCSWVSLVEAILNTVAVGIMHTYVPYDAELQRSWQQTISGGCGSIKLLLLCISQNTDILNGRCDAGLHQFSEPVEDLVQCPPWTISMVEPAITVLHLAKYQRPVLVTTSGCMHELGLADVLYKTRCILQPVMALHASPQLGRHVCQCFAKYEVA